MILIFIVLIKNNLSLYLSHNILNNIGIFTFIENLSVNIVFLFVIRGFDVLSEIVFCRLGLVKNVKLV